MSHTCTHDSAVAAARPLAVATTAPVAVVLLLLLLLSLLLFSFLSVPVLCARGGAWQARLLQLKGARAAVLSSNSKGGVGSGGEVERGHTQGAQGWASLRRSPRWSSSSRSDCTHMLCRNLLVALVVRELKKARKTSLGTKWAALPFTELWLLCGFGP